MNKLCPICNRPLVLIDGLHYCADDELYCDLQPTSFSYDDVYLLHYKLYAKTDLSVEINQARGIFVRDYVRDGVLLDFGCGARAFEKSHIMQMGRWKIYSYDPYFHRDHSFLDEKKIDVLTFWDSLEHINRLNIIKIIDAEHVFVTTPVIDDVPNIFCWKHYVPHEHVWLFSTNALINLFDKWGYTLIERRDIEASLRSKDVASFYFHKGRI